MGFWLVILPSDSHLHHFVLVPCAEKASCSNALQSFSTEGTSETSRISLGISFHPLDDIKQHCSSSALLQGSPDTCSPHLSPTYSRGSQGAAFQRDCGLCVNPELSCWTVPNLRLQLTKTVSERGLPGVTLPVGGLCYWKSQQWDSRQRWCIIFLL